MDDVNRLGELRKITRGRVDDIVSRLGQDMTKEQVVGTLTTMLMLAEFKGERDPLTKIDNRRSYDKLVKSLADDGSTRFSFLMFDIDHFKKINDEYGHATGDEILIHVVNKVKPALRKNDFFARIGGEEFAVIIPGDNSHDLETICEKVRASVESMVGFRSGQKDVPGVTISIGAGTYDHSESFDNFYRKIDAKLYEAKSNGRNQYAILEDNV